MPLPRAAEEELRRQVDSQLSKGLIRPNKSPWSSRPFVVPFVTGDYRVVIDYRQVNKQMLDDAFSIPIILENLQKESGLSYCIALADPVLRQVNDGRLEVIEYGSKKLTQAQ
ncbi:hypothetical protein GNI_149210 [Gregarina niphandrodes]|uniref:Uncharacterized protein n=1 Tax=Gregarina niphandrodes TaxID=110365 RepID=A0A023AZM2_GRENI|nr:hypothetical protein GNI_149210 [Gregarina niphandrodes]EZG44301.1 hypothetical protein GNI_149210 [Gregarina niphandrodes]|eukprot:XP_011132719.1 hypothetical protein GNI_149210 [Gregarina niphandrodes]